MFKGIIEFDFPIYDDKRNSVFSFCDLYTNFV